MDGIVNAILNHVEAGGSGIGWLLSAYLLLRLHQLTDRQHSANVRTVAALATIKALLMTRLGLAEPGDSP